MGKAVYLVHSLHAVPAAFGTTRDGAGAHAPASPRAPMPAFYATTGAETRQSSTHPRLPAGLSPPETHPERELTLHWKHWAGRLPGAAALVLVLAACGGGGGEVAIGTAGPFEEGYARMVRRAVEMAVDEINSEGGVRGSRLSVVAQDDGGDGVKAAQIAEGFLSDPQVRAVVGHSNSGAMVGAARVYDRGLVAVIPSATSPELTGVSPWVYRVTTNDSTNGANLARFAAGLRAKRVAVLYENNTYGRGLAAAFRDAYPGELIGVDPIAGDGRLVEPFISYYRQVLPDLVFVAGTELSGQALLREARRQGFTTRWVAGDGWSGVVTDTAASEGVYVA